MLRGELIESRRFAGREFLLWLWFESEVFDGTSTGTEGETLGLWIEKKLVLSNGAESTRITAPMPGRGREAKEALLRGQMPESAAFRVAWKDDETSFALKAESLALGGLKLRTVTDTIEADGGFDLVDEMAGKRKGAPPKRAKSALEPEDDDSPFYERMAQTREVEQLVESFFARFVRLRLDARWAGVVLPAMQRWVRGETVDPDVYRAKRDRGGSNKARAKR